jgi:hypothetical protein
MIDPFFDRRLWLKRASLAASQRALITMTGDLGGPVVPLLRIIRVSFLPEKSMPMPMNQYKRLFDITSNGHNT